MKERLDAKHKRLDLRVRDLAYIRLTNRTRCGSDLINSAQLLTSTSSFPAAPQVEIEMLCLSDGQVVLTNRRVHRALALALPVHVARQVSVYSSSMATSTWNESEFYMTRNDTTRFKSFFNTCVREHHLTRGYVKSRAWISFVRLH
jgi:hypothetical protein